MDTLLNQAIEQTQAASTRAFPTEDSEDSDQPADAILIEEFEISGEALLDAIRALIRQNNVRRIAIQNEEGNSLLRIPMAIGVVGHLIEIDLSCEAVSIGVIAAVVPRPHIVIEREETH